jgi:hypothetical protein
MEPGRPQTNQSGVPSGFKRCSQRVDPRCIARDGILPEEYYRVIRPYAPTPRIAFCKCCESYKQTIRNKKPDELEARKRRRSTVGEQQAMGRQTVYMYKVLYDPSGTYQRHALFQLQDFTLSLDTGVWPEGMMVRDLETAQCYAIEQMELIEIPDRNWFEYRKEMVCQNVV